MTLYIKAALLALLFCPSSLLLAEGADADGAEDTGKSTVDYVDVSEESKQFYVIPYPYYNAVTEATVGVVFAAHGYLQPQVKAFTNFIYSSNDSRIAYLEISDYQIYDRLFGDLKVLTGYWGAVDLYLDRSNDSSKNNFITIGADDDWWRMDFRYLLPIGSGRDHILPIYREYNGTADPATAPGGQAYNPMTSGRTYILDFGLIF